MGRTVLVVDDEPDIRSIIVLTHQHDFAVLQAADADEAMQIARTQKIDLLLTDLEIGNGMNGIDLAERMNEEMPGIRTLVISGSPKSEILAAAKGLPHLRKPFLPIALLERVRHILATKVRAQTETRGHRGT
jgi:DNA-binding response OmpR family regulator